MSEQRSHTIATYTVSAMLGQLREGELDAGARFHAVAVGRGTHANALCGAKPGRRSVGWGDEQPGATVTCPRCLRKLLKAQRSDEVAP